MKKKKDVIVWDQFEQVDTNEDTNHTNKDQVPTLTRNYETDELTGMKKVTQNIKQLKPFFIAMFSAVFIGSILGILMLDFLTNVNDQPNHTQQPAGSTQTTDDQENDSSNTELAEQQTSHSLSVMRGYVLQVGVFNEKDNAENWLSTYASVGLPMSLWQRNEQYFLFAGIAATKEDADQLASSIDNDEVEIYVKEWETPEYEVHVTSQTYEWLVAFQEQWQQSIEAISANGRMNIEKWQDLLDDASLEDAYIEPLVKELTQWMDSLGETDGQVNEQAFLLAIWHQFASTINL